MPTAASPGLHPDTRDRLTRAFASVLDAEGLTIPAEAVAHAVLEAIAGAAVPLTEAERGFLDEHGGVAEPADVFLAPMSAALHRSLDVARESGSLDTARVAELLGVSRPTVTRRRAAGDLHGEDVDGKLVFPEWQFNGNEALPGLAIAVADVPAGWGRRRLARFMTTPEESLDGQSPVRWLADGSDPRAVADVLRAESHE